MSLLTGLLAYYKLDEASGNALDATGGGASLTEFLDTMPSAAGALNNCRKIPGLNSGNMEGFVTGLNASGVFTIAGWVKTSDITNGSGIWHVSDSAFSSRYEADTTKIDIRLQSTPLQDVRSDAGLIANDVWFFMAATSDGSTEFNLWVNSTKYTGTWGDPSAVIVDPRTFVLDGAGATSTDTFHDEVGIWNRVLSDLEIASLYGSGTPLGYPAFGDPPTPMPQICL